MEQLAPAALGALFQTHAVLRQRADTLAGSPELARAWRAWAALAKVRRQVEWLGLHLQQWRMQQLQQESWLAEAQELLRKKHEEIACNPPPIPSLLPEPPGLQRLMGMGFTREASVEALQDSNGDVELALQTLLEDADTSGLRIFLPGTQSQTTNSGSSAPDPVPSPMPSTPRSAWHAVKEKYRKNGS